MTTLYSTNFDSTAVGAIPSGWSSVTGGWQVNTAGAVSGAHGFGPTSTSDGVIAVNTNASTADGYIAHTWRFQGDTAVGGGYRADATFQNGYLWLLQPSTGGVAFYKRVNGAFNNVGSISDGAYPSTFATGDAINFEAHFVGGTHEVRVWKAGSARPNTASATFNDTTFTAAGYSCYYSGNSAGVAPNGIDDVAVADASGFGASTIVIAPNDPGILYSPANWSSATATNAKTINAGAYLKTLLAGATAVTLTFDVSNMGTPASQISYRFNGLPWTSVVVAATVVLTLPSSTAAAPYQLLEVVVKSTSEALTRWSTTSATAVVLTGLTVNSGVTASAPVQYPNDFVIFGDSIPEGVRAVNYTATNDTDRNDALMSFARAVGERMGCEVGVVGFGGTGWATAGSGSVPAFTSTYNLIMPGTNRTFPTGREPIAVAVILGTNDSSVTDAAETSAVQTCLNGLLSLYPTASIIVLRAFNGTKASAIQAGITAINSGRVFYEDTTGMFSTAYGADDFGLHPTGANHLGRIAPALAAKMVKYGQPRRFTVTAT